jgi:hypothetical protein
MQHTITFDLPDDNSELELCHNAPQMWSLLWDLSQEMRTFCKYGEDTGKDPVTVIENWRENINILLDKMEVE